MLETPTIRPMFVADWRDVLFVHLRVPPKALQPIVPLPLDLFDGDAFVSFVAFTQHRFRPSRGGSLSRWLTAPLAQHEFFNVRTYVRHEGGQGVYFLAEWIPNRLATMLAPRVYGLPYRLADLQYFRDRRDGRHLRHVAAAGRQLILEAHDNDGDCCAAREGSLEAFLAERYSAFTRRRSMMRRFEVRHDPWRLRPVKASLAKTDLLSTIGSWHRDAKIAAAHFSPGVANVSIGWPETVGTANASASVDQ